MKVVPESNPPMYQFDYIRDQQTISLRTRKRVEVGECLLRRQLPRFLSLPPMSSDWMFNRRKPKDHLDKFVGKPEVGAGLPFYQVSFHSLSTTD